MDADGLKEVCRACLCTDRAMCSLLESLVPKFDSPPNSVVDVWKIFTKILTASEDRCPDKICVECSDEIQRMYDFILKCKRSGDILKKMNPTEICLKKLKFINGLSEQNSVENIKSENDMLPNTSQFTTETIEWNDRHSGNDEEVTDRRQFEEVILANVDIQEDSRSQPALLNPLQDDNFGNELIDQEDTFDVIEAEDKSCKISSSNIVREDAFDEIEAEDKSCIEIAECPACQYECRVGESLEQHIIENHMEEQMWKRGNKVVQCKAIEHCSKDLHAISTNVVVKSTIIKRYKCKVCAKKFRFESDLKRHLMIHTGERPFKCEICPTTFIRETHLKDHLKCHTGERKFKCEICQKTFIRKTHLTLHLKCHTGERPFKCKICQRAFIQNCDLTLHLKRHTGERPFICEICSKTFICKTLLKDHLRCHTGERPFKCEHCPKTFTRKHHLNDHLRTHMGRVKDQLDIIKN